LKQAERGAVLALLGSAERVLMLIARLDAERRSVPRVVPQRINVEVAPSTGFGGAAPQPAE
jgi:phosphate:Na+ symporter